MAPLLSSQSSSVSLPSLSALLLLVSLQCHVASSALLYSLKHHHNSIHHQRPMIHANQTNCAMFVGTWVHDDTYPLYQSSSCPIIDPQFNCKMFGRPDSDYLKYRWRPLNCELPRYTETSNKRAHNMFVILSQWNFLQLFCSICICIFSEMGL